MEKLCKLDFYEMGWMGEREGERGLFIAMAIAKLKL
jgi:hypothetical protein